jgi:teichuronic acid exporter
VTALSMSHRTVSGIAWAYAAFFFEKVAVFASTALLARFLSPADFGSIATALLLLVVFDVLRECGMREALIYVAPTSPEAASTVFWFGAISGMICTVVVVLLSPTVARYFDNAVLGQILPIMSLSFVINGFGLVQEAVLQQKLAFRRRYVVDLLAAVGKFFVTLVLALSGLGLWSLVFAFLGSNLLRTVGWWWATAWRPQPSFSARQWRNLFDHGKHVVFVRLLDLLIERADQFAVLLFLNQTSLGLLYIASRVPEIFIYHFSLVLTRVLFPIFAAIRHDYKLLQQYLLTISRLTAYLALPIGAGLALVSDLLTSLFFGPGWEASAPVMAVLSLAGAVQCLLWSAGDALKAVGRFDVTTKLSVLELLISFPLVFGLVYFSGQLLLAAFGSLCSAMAVNLLRMLFVNAILQIKPTRYLAVLVEPIATTMLMAVAVLAFRYSVGHASPLFTLVGSVAVGVLAYIAICWVWNRSEIEQGLEFLRFYRQPLDSAQKDSG